MTRAVFLDRDGVLNRAFFDASGGPRPPHSLAELEILPGVHSALDHLHAIGYLLVVVTNQPDVSRGRQRRDVVEAMHHRLRQELPLDDIRVCWDQEQDCYKPKPGMILDAAREWHIDLAASFMVGDRWKDIVAGRAAGCKTVLIGNGYAEWPPELSADSQFPSLDAFARSFEDTAPISTPGERSAC